MKQPGAGHLALIALLVSSTSCAAHRFALPTGDHVPATEGAARFDEATRACRAVHSYSSTLTVSGRVDGRNIPKLTVFAGATSDGGIYLDAKYAQAPVFTLGGTTERTTLVLQRDNTTLTAPAADVLDALVNLDLTPARWLALMTGCVTSGPSAGVLASDRYGDRLVVTLTDAVVVLAPLAASWRITGARFDHLTVQYDAAVGEWPARWTLMSEAGAGASVELDVSAADPLANDPRVTTAGFAVTPPAGATTITIEQLRAKKFGK